MDSDSCRDVTFLTGCNAYHEKPVLEAVRCEELEMLVSLLDDVNKLDAWMALLLAVSLSKKDAINTILTHPKFHDYSFDDVDTWVFRKTDNPFFKPEETPLCMAAQKDSYQTVVTLLSRGARITLLHDFDCPCCKCSHDDLYMAKKRLSIYRSLATNSYMSLGFQDSLLNAFRLIRKLKLRMQEEKYFKTEYQQLCEQLCKFTVRILDEVRDAEELDIVLSKTSDKSTGSRTRLRMAISYENKQFVAHPSCQSMLEQEWRSRDKFLSSMTTAKKCLWSVAFLLIYPVLASIYLVYPFGRVGELVETPLIRFAAHAWSQIFFVVLIVVKTCSSIPSTGLRLLEYPVVGALYGNYINSTGMLNMSSFIENVYIRTNDLDIPSWIILIFVIGQAWRVFRLIGTFRLDFAGSWYNLMDATMCVLYLGTYGLRIYSNIKVKASLKHFSHEKSWQKLLFSNNTVTEDLDFLYWLNADRQSWYEWDPILLSDAVFAVANIICLIRIAQIFEASNVLGPLLISLKLMVKNVFVFMVLFLVLTVAFILGFQSLYWYFNISNRKRAETSPHPSTQAESHFGNAASLVKTAYFSAFSMVDTDAVEIGEGYKGAVTLAVANVLFAAYHWVTIIILINMLIGMMAHSYESVQAEKDTEWKFSRTKLYLFYMKDCQVVSVPFNLIPSWHGIRGYWQQVCDRKGHGGREHRHSLLSRNSGTKQGRKRQNHTQVEMTEADPMMSSTEAKGSNTSEPPSYEDVMDKITKRMMVKYTLNNYS